MTRQADLYYWEGEKPPALNIRYEDNNGVLITTISGATLAAKCKIDAQSEFSETMTNNDDGTMTIDWNTTTSRFDLDTSTIDGIIRIDVEVTQGSNVWFLPRFSLPVKKRT